MFDCPSIDRSVSNFSNGTRGRRRQSRHGRALTSLRQQVQYRGTDAPQLTVSDNLFLNRRQPKYYPLALEYKGDKLLVGAGLETETETSLMATRTAARVQRGIPAASASKFCRDGRQTLWTPSSSLTSTAVQWSHAGLTDSVILSKPQVSVLSTKGSGGSKQAIYRKSRLVKKLK